MRNPYQPLDQIGLIIDGLDIGAVVSTIREQGYAVVENFLPPQAIAEIRQAFNTEVPITEMRAIGTETGRTWRCTTYWRKPVPPTMFLDPRLRAVVEGIIPGKYNQINVTTLFNTLPGETKQFFHQDDGLWPIPRPHPPFLCNALIAFDDFTKENGATHLVPYSHTWTHPVDQNTDSIQIEMPSGSVVFWDGGMWHAGGANVTDDEERMGFFINHQVSYLRPQEMQPLAIPPRRGPRHAPQTAALSGLSHLWSWRGRSRSYFDVLGRHRSKPDAQPADYWRRRYSPSG